LAIFLDYIYLIGKDPTLRELGERLMRIVNREKWLKVSRYFTATKKNT
jgi:hypothetical protein